MVAGRRKFEYFLHGNINNLDISEISGVVNGYSEKTPESCEIAPRQDILEFLQRVKEPVAA